MLIPFNEIAATVMAVMIATFEALLVFLLFLPGFISQRIIELLTPRRKRTTMVRIIDGAALSILVYLLYLAVASAFSLEPLPVVLDPTAKTLVDIDGLGAIAILAISVVVGALIGKSLEFGWFYWFLRAEYLNPRCRDRSCRYARFIRKLRRWLQFTRSTGRDTVWEDVLSYQKTHLVAVNLKDGRKVIGKCEYFSDNLEHPELLIVAQDPSLVPDYLQGITVIRGGKVGKLPGEGFFITSSAEIDSIELLGGTDVE